MEDVRNNSKITAKEAENPDELTLRILDILRGQTPGLTKKNKKPSPEQTDDGATEEGMVSPIKPQLAPTVNPFMNPPKP